MKINLGCGSDYKEGFVNIDGNIKIKADKYLCFPEDNLCTEFKKETVEYVLCKDFLEHHYHFDAVEILNQIYKVLITGSKVDIRIPNMDYLLSQQCHLTPESKLLAIYGGQDKKSGNKIMDDARLQRPDYHAHKFGWTKKQMVDELKSIGFIVTSVEESNNRLDVWFSGVK